MSSHTFIKRPYGVIIDTTLNDGKYYHNVSMEYYTAYNTPNPEIVIDITDDNSES